MTLDEFFVDSGESRRIFDALRSATDELGPVELRITKSQVAFRRRIGFAWAWIPGTYLTGERPPLVLSVSLRRRDDSSRWKEIVEPYPGRFMHHLELRDPSQIDAEVRDWLAEAWRSAG
jgi:hypothetical protein